MNMRAQILIFATFGSLALSACAQKAKEVATAAPPPPPGSIAGSTAADRNGDGIVDGYYTSDGIYHPTVMPTAPTIPATLVTRAGERG
jgi:hypothetical protein